MKIVMLALFFACLTFPAFSESTNVERFRALDNTIDSAVSNSTSRLSEFDELLTDSGNFRNYMAYRQRYINIANAIQESDFQAVKVIYVPYVYSAFFIHNYERTFRYGGSHEKFFLPFRR